MTNSYNRAFGTVLRSFRIERRVTQESLGFSAGRDRTYISLLELGQRSPTLDTIVVLCRALNVTLNEFIAAVEREADSSVD
ncbi:helix-turn-helix domain-containing protein (plasmid) [Burkholderia vietnamiensis]|uniref:Transcriptional regulator, XRE family n=1 Tax=Burkholderia vietnamiensis (strain G4 / LMG 22486) TaxID=269482 RepID=A4JVH3_BURVG|nr:transcriptional regulator, XRE family [Burkholderia vietnamiensis G4]MCB4349464.1 helix-turn-helix domain-containing protein [Burkholderia vietnamiensis]